MTRTALVAATCLILLSGGVQPPRAWCDEPPAARPAGDAPDVDVSVPGVYRAGAWEYRLEVTAPGSRSEGTLGTLLYAGKPVTDAAGKGDYFTTPWGAIQWVGRPVVAWGAHGWMLRPAGAQGGRALPEPWLLAGGPVVMALVLAEGEGGAADEIADEWVRQELAKREVKGCRVARPWFPLSDQAATLYDTKLHGTLTVRLAPARDGETLTILLGGSKPERLALPRQDGARELVLHAGGTVLAEQNSYLVFRVDRAARTWPRPLDVGPDADGTEVVVTGTREVVISLPGDGRSGLVWRIRKIQGDAPLASSVTAAGEPQFTPTGEASGAGTFENVLRVVCTGKSWVELEYRRPWQTDVPAERTFTVTLDVQDVPAASE